MFSYFYYLLLEETEIKTKTPKKENENKKLTKNIAMEKTFNILTGLVAFFSTGKIRRKSIYILQRSS